MSEKLGQAEVSSRPADRVMDCAQAIFELGIDLGLPVRDDWQVLQYQYLAKDAEETGAIITASGRENEAGSLYRLRMQVLQQYGQGSSTAYNIECNFTFLLDEFNRWQPDDTVGKQTIFLEPRPLRPSEPHYGFTLERTSTNT